MKKKKKKVIRFRGIVAAARELRVSREHLYRVLTGERTSKRLLSRYHALQESK